MPINSTPLYSPPAPTPDTTSTLSGGSSRIGNDAAQLGTAPTGWDMQSFYNPPTYSTSPALPAGTTPPTSPISGGRTDVAQSLLPDYTNTNLGSASSGTYGYQFDRSKGYYVDANGQPAPGTTAPNSSAPLTSAPPPGAPTGPNSYGGLAGIAAGGLMTNPTYTGTWPGETLGTTFGVNPNYYATQGAAQQVAQLLGGTLSTQNYAVGGTMPDQQFVSLPNGQTVNVGNILAVLQNPFFQSSPGMMQQEILNVLNQANVGQPTNGSYAWQNGQLAYNPQQPWAGIPYTLNDPASMARWVGQQASLGYGTPRVNFQATPGQAASGWTTDRINGTLNSAAQSGAQQYGAQAGAAPSQASQSALTQLQQLAQLFQLMSGFQAPQAAAPQPAQPQSNGLSPQVLATLVALLGGQQEPSGGLYSRSQYPRFP